METILAMAIILPFGLMLELWIFYSARVKGRRVPMRHCVLTILFLCSCAALLAILGLPSIVDFHPEHWRKELILIPFVSMIKNPMGNLRTIFSFLPFGFLWPLVWKSTARQTIIAGCWYSLAIEFLQLFNWRTTSINDWILNVVGTMLGYLLLHLLQTHLKKGKVWLREPSVEVPEHGLQRYEKRICILLPWISQFIFYPIVTGGITSFSVAH